MLKKASIGSRYFLGVIFTVFGLNGFFNFIPQPPLPAEAGAFMGALAAAKYMFPMIKLTEVICGILLLSGRFVPLALVVLAPVVLNIFMFHRFLAPVNPMDPILVLTWVLASWGYRHEFKGLLKSKSSVQI